ncbi:MAG: stage III sporulation AC/AD family protein [Oscillospiraceae bacterium]|nr:stage III sporulation AC/AD family protein [Oscillospiraceae bacterium]
MDVLFKAAGLAIAGLALTVLLKKETPELGMLLALFVSCAVLMLCFDLLRDVLGFMLDMIDLAGLPDDTVTPVIKTSCVAIVTKITADICRDAKETGIATGIETAGAVVGLYVVLPLFQSLLDMMKSLL